MSNMLAVNPVCHRKKPRKREVQSALGIQHNWSNKENFHTAEEDRVVFESTQTPYQEGQHP